MKKILDRRSFLRIAGISMGAAALYQFAPRLAFGQAVSNSMREANGEAPAPFRFAQLSDAHVGFNGPPDPLGTQAFEHAVELLNTTAQPPELVLFTGDLTHDADNRDEHVSRMRKFKEIAGRLKTSKLYFVPGEHDAGLDGGQLYREFFGESSYSFDFRGVHFVGLDNVSRAKPEVGPERRVWLAKDLARFSNTTPIVVFTHRPLFDLKPEWEWFTSDGPEVMKILTPFENVTVLYGHIHRRDVHREGTASHYAARSMIFSFPDPQVAKAKKPNPFDKGDPFKNLGLRMIDAGGGGAVAVNDVELNVREFAGRSGIQQIMKAGVLG
jgi:3',5'-cyclic AMP phosphodiesterase CpdA